ncbi:MAG TPA: histidine phosphatase family protein [Lachnospiraceae bacterium]|nr:histidine phosphatase family protein [Lachnospiraceae bacterium]
MIIYLIRHGRQNSPDCNVNVPLAEEGHTQARLLGERMKRYKLDAVYASDLIRAVETAKTAFSYDKKLAGNIQIRPGLAEIDFGILTGQKDEEVKKFYKEYYKEQLDKFVEGRIQHGTALDEVNAFIGDFFVPPEEMWYPEGENGPMVLERVMPVVKEWIESGMKNIVVVTHGGVIRILLCALFGGDFAKRLMFGTSLQNCSITQIHYDEEKNGFYLDRFNDFAHLEMYPELLRG